MSDAPLFHSRYTLWTIAGASLVVVAAVVRVLAGASAALLAIAATLVLAGVLATGGSRTTLPTRAGTPWNDADVAEEGVTD